MTVRNSIIPSLDRALDIIEYLAAAQSPITLKQIAKDLEIPVTSVFRMLKNFTARGYVNELKNGYSSYVLGYKILSIASSFERNSSFQAVSKRIIVQLANEIQQTVQLGVWRNGNLIYIDQALSSAPLSVIAPLYEPIAINVSASAKVILGYLSEKEQRNALNNCEFSRLTGHTITDRELFLKEIQRSQVLGYGLDDEEFAIGIGCLAVPIFDEKNTCIASLGITGSIKNYREQKSFEKMLLALREASAQITSNLRNY